MSSRTDALNTIIELALSNETITVDNVLENCDTSRSTAKRALYEADDYGWLTKRSKSSHSWQRGDLAHKFSNGYTARPFDTDSHSFYYVYTGSVDAPSYMTGEKILVSAGMSWQESGAGFSVAPDFETEHLLVDSGGYQAALHFRDEYPYSAEQYHRWAEDIGADIVFGMDWACEDAEKLVRNTQKDISADDLLPWEERWERSLKYQIRQQKEHEENNYSHNLVPVAQGQEPRHFKQSVENLKKSDLSTDLIAIGTVCKRSNTSKILDVVDTVSNVVGHNNIHLFGATLNIWKDGRFIDKFMSSDSAAWLQHDPKSSRFPEDEARAFNNYKQKAENTTVMQSNQQ